MKCDHINRLIALTSDYIKRLLLYFLKYFVFWYNIAVFLFSSRKSHFFQFICYHIIHLLLNKRKKKVFCLSIASLNFQVTCLEYFFSREGTKVFVNETKERKRERERERKKERKKERKTERKKTSY